MRVLRTWKTSQTNGILSRLRKKDHLPSVVKSAVVSCAEDKKNIKKAVFSEAKVTNTYLILNQKIKGVSLAYPDPDMRRRGGLQKIFFRLPASVWSKNKGGLPWIPHWISGTLVGGMQKHRFL